MARPDLTNEEVERMGRENPGSAAEYLRLRREELEAEKQAEREADDFRHYAESFVAAGGDPKDAEVAYEAHRFEQAAAAAKRADEAAHQETRRHVAGRL